MRQSHWRQVKKVNKESAVALHAAEEESIEALKKWWQDNGKGLIYTAAALFAGVTG